MAVTVLLVSAGLTCADAQNLTTDGTTVANDGGIMAVITISVLALGFIIAVLTAKFFEYLHARKSIRDNASDISEYTRDILKGQFLMMAFNRAKNKGKQDPREIARRYGKTWRAKVARNHARRLKTIMEAQNQAEEGESSPDGPGTDKKPVPTLTIITDLEESGELEDATKDNADVLKSTSIKETTGTRDTKQPTQESKSKPNENNTAKKVGNPQSTKETTKNKKESNRTTKINVNSDQVAKKPSLPQVDYTDEVFMPEVSLTKGKHQNSDSQTSLSSRGDYEFLTVGEGTKSTPVEPVFTVSGKLADPKSTTVGPVVSVSGKLGGPDGSDTPHSLSAVKLEGKDSPRNSMENFDIKTPQGNVKVLAAKGTNTKAQSKKTTGNPSRPGTAKSVSNSRPITAGARRPVSARAITPSGTRVVVKVPGSQKI